MKKISRKFYIICEESEEKKHLSQKDVAEKMETTQQVVSKIENGNPSIRTFYAYCRAIGVI